MTVSLFSSLTYIYIQVTSEALILRRFPDESITSRLWNDHVTEIECNKDRSTVTVRYRDAQGEYNHHFHTKQVPLQCEVLYCKFVDDLYSLFYIQFSDVYESLLKLIPQLSG